MTRTLRERDVVLRSLRRSDQRAIVRLCTDPDIARFLSMPISSDALFERYLKWSRQQRRRGTCAAFAVTTHGDVVGIMQVRVTHPGVGEVGWVLSQSVWSTHVFESAARLLCRFALDDMELKRLEARVAVHNPRARRAIEKIGGQREATMRKSLRLGTTYFDEELWAIFRDSTAPDDDAGGRRPARPSSVDAPVIWRRFPPDDPYNATRTESALAASLEEDAFTSSFEGATILEHRRSFFPANPSN